MNSLQNLNILPKQRFRDTCIVFGISLLRECLIFLQVSSRILETVYKISLIGFHPRQASEWMETAGCNKYLVSNWLANPSSLGWTTRITSGSMQSLIHTAKVCDHQLLWEFGILIQNRNKKFGWLLLSKNLQWKGYFPSKALLFKSF